MAKYPRLPLEQVAEILDAYVQAGMTPFEIGEMHHIAEGHVLQILREHEVLLDKHKGPQGVAKKFSEYQISEMVDEYNQGGSVRALIAKYGLTYQSFYSLLNEIGAPTRKLAPQNVKHRFSRLQRAVELYVDGIPMWKIEDETGIVSMQIYKEVHKRGIPLRTRQLRFQKRE